MFRALWKEEAKLNSIYPGLNEELLAQERNIFSSLDRSTSLGLSSVRRIAHSLNISGVYGPVYELFDSDEIYYTAIEAVAGNSLFHVVVETDEIATRILSELNKESNGRITFIPLNRIKNSSTIVIDNHELKDKYIHMLDIMKIGESEKFGIVFRQIFGRAVIVEDLKVGFRLVRDHKISAITLDGDKVDSRGAFTGGYVDLKNSRLSSARFVRSLQSKVSALLDQMQYVSKQSLRLDQELSKVSGRIVVLETDLESNIHNLNASVSSISAVTIDLNQIVSEKLDLEQQIPRLENNLEFKKAKIKSLNTELLSPMVHALTSEETEELKILLGEEEQIKSELVSILEGADRDGLSKEIDSIQFLLETHLLKRKEELEHLLSSVKFLSLYGNDHDVQDYRDNLLCIDKTLLELDEELKVLEKEQNDISALVSGLSDDLDEEQICFDRKMEGYEMHSSVLTRYISKKSSLMQKKEELVQKIRDLGHIPQEILHEYQLVSSTKLVKNIHDLTEKLKEFRHVNIKALEQYSTFSKQKQSLLERNRDLDKSLQSINQFIATLDVQKDDIVYRTFEQVSRNFSSVFKQIVSAGSASLIPVMNDSESTERSSHSISAFSGVSIHVSFSNSTSAHQQLSQLSGGQKSVVSLCFIFAIQKCDPAPFYLFDEIDANLDVVYRTAIAKMIKDSVSNPKRSADDPAPVQIILTTFRPEMALVADNFYGVSFSHKVSCIQSITKESAMEFIEYEVHGSAGSKDSRKDDTRANNPNNENVLY